MSDYKPPLKDGDFLNKLQALFNTRLLFLFSRKVKLISVFKQRLAAENLKALRHQLQSEITDQAKKKNNL